jgi:hypothetical protein
MSFSIDQIKGLMNAKGGAAKPNLFAVQFPSLQGATSSEVNLLCTGVNIPGKSIITYDRDIGIRRDKIAYGQMYEDLTLSFLLLNDYGIRKYFDMWQEKTVSTDYQIRYKNEYAYQIKVSQLKKGFGLPVYSTPLGVPKLPAEIQNRLPKIGPFDFAQGQFDLDFLTGDKAVYTMTLEEAFPTVVSQTALNNSANDAISELTVNFAYTRFTTVNRQATPAADFVQSQVGTLIGNLANKLF